ncbi:MAG: hypothetical protein OXU23_17745 [Candidatus Poribacteria bacterium]|nr:hypothetical protein [Candidatus Poribacteria bacterium]
MAKMVPYWYKSSLWSCYWRDKLKKAREQIPLPSVFLYFRYLNSLLRGRLVHPKTKFLIFGQGRTGSTLLTSLLNSHPEITCDGEILARRVLNPLLYVTCKSRIQSASEVYGFKVKIYQLTRTQKLDDVIGFFKRLIEDQWQVIYLKRENLLRHAISNMIAENTRLYHRFSDDQAFCKKKINVNYQQLLIRMEKRERFQEAELEVLEHIHYIPLIYERNLVDADAQQETVDMLCDLIEISRCPVQTNLVRINRGTLSNIVCNYHEIRTKIEQTRFAQFLD